MSDPISAEDTFTLSDGTVLIEPKSSDSGTLSEAVPQVAFERTDTFTAIYGGPGFASERYQSTDTFALTNEVGSVEAVARDSGTLTEREADRSLMASEGPHEP